MKKVILTAVLLSAATLAMADKSVTSFQQNGLYFGAGAGYVSFDMSNLVNSQSVSQDNFTANAHGGYLFSVFDNFFMGAEIGYNYLPNVTYGFNATATTAAFSVKYNSYMIDYLAVAKYFIKDRFDIFLKAGVAYINQTVTVIGSVPTSDTVSDRFPPKLGLGFGFYLAKYLEVTVEDDYTFGDNMVPERNRFKVPANNVVFAGLNFHFNI